MHLRFWGVRGSVPWAIPAAIGHGCNTPCLEITDEYTGSTIVFDAGSGIVGLGGKLTGPPRVLPIVLTHYHWDHLQGLPFLPQIYEPGWTLRIHAPALQEASAASIDAVFQSPFFPVPYSRLPNRPEVQMIAKPGEMTIGGFDVTSIALNHPGGSFGYRIRAATGDVVYATDHEFGDPAFDEPRSATVVALGDAQLRRITRQAFARVLADHPERTQELLRQLARRVGDASARMASFDLSTGSRSSRAQSSDDELRTPPAGRGAGGA